MAWGWAVNGFASVVGSALATVLSMTFGFDWVLFLGLACYVLAVAAWFRLSRGLRALLMRPGCPALRGPERSAIREVLANRLDVVAVGIVDEGSVIVGVVLGPNPWLVEDLSPGVDRRLEERSYGGSVRRGEGEVRFAESLPARCRADPEIGHRSDAEADDIPEVHHPHTSDRGQDDVVERSAGVEVRTLDGHVVEHALIVPHRRPGSRWTRSADPAFPGRAGSRWGRDLLEMALNAILRSRSDNAENRVGGVAAMAVQGPGIEPLPLSVDDEVLDDLVDRVRRTRWTDSVIGAGWAHGTNIDYLRELADFWVEGFDWRSQERMLNDRLPGWSAEIAGRRIHFARCPGVGPDPLPLVLLHGWPGSFAEMSKVAPLLADPARSGWRPSRRLRCDRALVAWSRALGTSASTGLRCRPVRRCGPCPDDRCRRCLPVWRTGR